MNDDSYQFGQQRFYIASSRDRVADVKALAERLTAHGLIDAFDWRRHFEHRCSLATCGMPDRAALATNELAAASSCDLFIGIARLGKGSHVELGAALVSRTNWPKRVILVGVEPGESVFYDAQGVEVFRAIGNALDALGVG